MIPIVYIQEQFLKKKIRILTIFFYFLTLHLSTDKLTYNFKSVVSEQNDSNHSGISELCDSKILIWSKNDFIDSEQSSVIELFFASKKFDQDNECCYL